MEYQPPSPPAFPQSRDARADHEALQMASRDLFHAAEGLKRIIETFPDDPELIFQASQFHVAAWSRLNQVLRVHLGRCECKGSA